MPEVMKFELASKEGVVLQTAGKYCTHDIMVEPVVEDLTVTSNGTYPVPEGHTGHGDLTVDVQPNLTAVMLTENGTYAAPDDADGYSEVTVDVQPKLANVTIRDNGTHPVPEGYDGFGEITIDVDAFPIDDVYLTLSKAEYSYSDGAYFPMLMRASDFGYEVGCGKYFGVIADLGSSTFPGIDIMRTGQESDGTSNSDNPRVTIYIDRISLNGSYVVGFYTNTEGRDKGDIEMLCKLYLTITD